MGLARELAVRIAALGYADLPEEAIYWGKIAILDTLGVALAGALEDGPRILDDVLGLPDSGPSLVLGTSRRASALDAALINGTAAHALDFDNTAASLGGSIRRRSSASTRRRPSARSRTPTARCRAARSKPSSACNTASPAR